VTSSPARTSSSARASRTVVSGHVERPFETRERDLSSFVAELERLWNSGNAQTILAAYSPDTIWRDRGVAWTGRIALREWISTYCDRAPRPFVRFRYWGAAGTRIAVVSQRARLDDAGRPSVMIGPELWELDACGLICRTELDGR